MAEAASSPPELEKPLLDIETLITRPHITIDDQSFEVLHPDELTVIEQARFGRAGRKIDQLAQFDSDDASKVEETDAKLKALVEQTARKIVVEVSEETWAKLSGAHHWAIVDVFTALSLRQKMAVAGAMVRSTGDIDAMFRPEPTGAKSSPASSASTAGQRSTGWLNALRGWFGRTG